MFKKSMALAVTATFFASLPAPAHAQLEEIVVTAAKREQTLQEVPIAVSVTDAETIERSQINDILDLQTVVPSLRVSQLQRSANTTFIIRGFGNGSNDLGIEPSVGVFIDGVYRSRSAGAISDLPNLQRVEVLRGPQSTLFGKNASAGVISVITEAPQFEFGGSAELVAGNYGQVIARGDITGPLSDNVAYSLNAFVNERDGYYDNLTTGNEINERGRWGVRGQLLIEPTNALSLRFIADYDKVDEICCGTSNLLDGPTGAAIRGAGGDIFPEDPFAYAAFYNYDPQNEIENGGVSLQADLDLGDYSLVSITSFRTQESFDNADSDFTSADVLGETINDSNIDTLTQEFRVQSSFGDAADWMLGLFYFSEELDYESSAIYGTDTRAYLDLLAAGGITGVETALGLPAGTFFAQGQGVRETFKQDDDALSLFGQVDWYLTDKATLTFGLNYTTDEKDVSASQVNSDVFASVDFVQVGLAQIFSGLTGLAPTPDNFAMNPMAFMTAQGLSTVPCSAAAPPPGCNQLLALQPLQFLPPFFAFPNQFEPDSTDDSDTTWTIRLAYDITDSINIYASAATGFKASSWNLTRDSRPLPADLADIVAAGQATPNLTSGTRFAGPEESTVYELGLKAQFTSGAFNLAIFDQEIEGFQSSIFQGTGFVLNNAGKQSTFGVEFDASYFPTDALQLTLAATWLDPEYDSFVGAAGVGGPVDLSGTQPAGIHEISAVGSATYFHDFANGMTGFIRGEYSYDDEVRVIENVPESVASRDVGLLNASFGIETPNGLEVFLWGRNLTDDEFLQSAFPGVAQDGSFFGYPNPPRTYGITLRKSFN